MSAASKSRQNLIQYGAVAVGQIIRMYFTARYPLYSNMLIQVKLTIFRAIDAECLQSPYTPLVFKATDCYSVANCDWNRKLLHKLSLESLLRCFTAVNLSPRKFPAITQAATRSPFPQQNTTIMQANTSDRNEHTITAVSQSGK